MMDEAIKNNRIKQNDIIATSGFGAGLSWGAALLNGVKTKKENYDSCMGIPDRVRKTWNGKTN